MEYRGYDSAGVAVVSPEGISLRPIRRQADQPRERHPHRTGRRSVRRRPHPLGDARPVPPKRTRIPHRDCTGKIVVVHNGIIENYLELKRELQAQGHEFKTETDTEIVAHLVEREMRDDGLQNAVRRALTYMRGMFAIVLLSVDDPEKIVAVRNGPPIVIGLGQDEFFVASDIPAILSPYAGRRVSWRRGDGHHHALGRRSSPTTTARPSRRQRSVCCGTPIAAEKGGHKHFMLKEIYEQPSAARDTILGRVSLERGEIFLEDLHIPAETFRALQKVTIIACGTSWHAGLVGST
jgi:glucosamine--fructose-6-phosphate aminotransferase (isomerizing)